MTMYEKDVEWFNDDTEIRAELKAAIWTDEDFKQFISDHGLEEALYEVTSFHRSVADNLRSNYITDLSTAPLWAKKAARLGGRLKARRQDLRRVLREARGQEAVDAINDKVSKECDD